MNGLERSRISNKYFFPQRTFIRKLTRQSDGDAQELISFFNGCIQLNNCLARSSLPVVIGYEVPTGFYSFFVKSIDCDKKTYLAKH